MYDTILCMQDTEVNNKSLIEDLNKAGGQYSLIKSRRHPSTKKYVLKSNDTTGMFDLNITVETLINTLDFIKNLGSNKHKILFVTKRDESIVLTRNIATNLNMPYVTGRWIGGTLSNFESIKFRIKRLQILREEYNSGKWDKYTKKEQILLMREMSNLNEHFYGLVKLEENLPQAVFVIDPRRDNIAVLEARILGIPVIAICNADANINQVDYPIMANNNTKNSVSYILNKVEEAYKNNK